MTKRRVAITGMEVVAPNGGDLTSFWDALQNGRSGIGPITRFDARSHDVRIAGELKDFDPSPELDRKEIRRNDAFTHYAVAVASRAVRHSGLDLEREDPERIGVIWGSGIGGIGTHEQQHTVLMEKGPARISPMYVPMMICDMAAGMISMKLGAKGPNYAAVSACASAAHAIGEATRKIQYGEAEVMVGGGSEAAVTPISIAGFAAARALSTRNDEPTRASRPFDRGRDGFVLSEGAAALILEDMEHARKRGADILAEVLGVGYTADAYHQTAMAPGGEGGARAIRAALRDAGLAPDAIDYVNAHGTSTLLGDVQETAALKAVFGAHAGRLAVSSTKSMTGHLLGATAAVESVACVLSLRHGVIPPTINLEDPDPECDLDYVPNICRRMPVRYAINTSFGFGGHNAVLVFGRFAG